MSRNDKVVIAKHQTLSSSVTPACDVVSSRLAGVFVLEDRMVRSHSNSSVSTSIQYARLLIAHLIPLACLLLFMRAVTTPAPAQADAPHTPPSLPHADNPTFNTRRPFGTGSDNTQGVVMGDINGDGYLDIAVDNPMSQSLVYLNDGKGNFYNGPVDCTLTTVMRCFGTATDWTYSVAVGDMDSDGDLDIVVGNYYYQQNAVYLNDGAGNFPISRTFGTGTDYTWSVAVGDINGDGTLDIVVGNYQQQNVVYLNHGDGFFTNTTGYTLTIGSLTFTWPNALKVGVGDLNGDGRLDIVVGSAQIYTLVYLNHGGDFTDTRTLGTASDATTSMAIGDLDNDGDLDIVLGNYNQQSVTYFNDGSGNFSAYPIALTYVTHRVAVGDMDGDGDLDIIMGNSNGFLNVVYLNEGGNFPTSYAFENVSSVPYGLAVGDVNGDGALDIIVGNDGYPNIIYLNDGAGAYPATSGYRRNFVTASITRTNLVAVGDMDGDGALDIVVGSYLSRSAVYLNDGTGFFTQTGYTRFFGAVSEDAYAIAIGDMNGDGALDIIVSNPGAYVGSSNPCAYTGGQNAIYLNNGAGYFTATNAYRPYGIATAITWGVAVGDMDGDSDLDIVAGNSCGQVNVVYLNDGTGNFPITRTIGSGASIVFGVTVGDLNDDGFLDIVVGNYSQQSFAYLNDGAGNFPPILSRPFGSGLDGTYSVAVGDMDGDGALDIIAGNDGQIGYMYLNDGLGNFYHGVVNCGLTANVRCFNLTTYRLTSVAVGDVNGDGALDIIVSNCNSSGFTRE